MAQNDPLQQITVLYHFADRRNIASIRQLGGLFPHAAGVREAIEAAGAKVLYLPPYSPDLNPIEMAFAKLKAMLCKAKDRSINTLWTYFSMPLHLTNACPIFTTPATAQLDRNPR